MTTKHKVQSTHVWEWDGLKSCHTLTEASFLKTWQSWKTGIIYAKHERPHVWIFCFPPAMKPTLSFSVKWKRILDKYLNYLSIFSHGEGMQVSECFGLNKSCFILFHIFFMLMDENLFSQISNLCDCMCFNFVRYDWTLQMIKLTSVKSVIIKSITSDWRCSLWVCISLLKSKK